MIDVVLAVDQCRSIDDGRRWSRAAINVDQGDQGATKGGAMCI